MVKINLTKTQKTALAVLVAAIVAAAALFVALPMLEPKGLDYAAVVDVKVYGPGWTMTIEGVGINNATVLNAIKAAGEKKGIDMTFTGTSNIESLNNTQNDGNFTWHCGFVQIDNVTKKAAVVLETEDMSLKPIQSGNVLVLWYTDDPWNNTPMLDGSLVTVDVKLYGPDWTIICDDLLIGLDNTTALDALKIAGRANGFTIETFHYVGMGDFITGINGTSGNMTHFWLFGVNGVSSDVGADSKIVSNGDAMVFWYTDDWMSQPPGA